MIEKIPVCKTSDKKRRINLSLKRPDKKANLNNNNNINNKLISNSTNAQQKKTHHSVTEKTTVSTSIIGTCINNNNNNYNNNIPDGQSNIDIKSSTSNTSLGEYQCPICNTDLTHIKTSYIRQTHVEQCLTGIATNENNDNYNHHDNSNIIYNDNTNENLFMDYCHFCGKDISKLSGKRKENHYDQCLNIIEKEKEMEDYIKRQEKLNTFAGQSLPFLQQLDICPSCHNTMKPNDLRSKIAHIKKCIKQYHLSIQQIIQKIHWMQWGHLPEQKATSHSSLPSSPVCTLENSTPSTPSLSQPSTFSVNITETTNTTMDITCNNNNYIDNDDDNDFDNKVIMYKIATWKKAAMEKTTSPTEDELVAMALSRSLLASDSSSSSSKKKNGKKDLNVSNILSIMESKSVALKALEIMINKKNSTNNTFSHISNQIPLVVSKVKAKYSVSSSSPSLSTPLLWKAASKKDIFNK